MDERRRHVSIGKCLNRPFLACAIHFLPDIQCTYLAAHVDAREPQWSPLFLAKGLRAHLALKAHDWERHFQALRSLQSQ